MQGKQVTMLQPDQMVGPYRIIRQIGQGGMATVYKAYHERLDRHVAIKVMHQALLQDPTFLTRFEREAKIIARLDHPHIVPVYDYSEVDGQPYLVMKFVEGCDLKALLERETARGNRLEIAHAIYIMLETCKGLNYAHTLEHPETHAPLNIVHRDVSPPNIMLSKNGEVKVVDFGLAKANSQVESTDPGVVKGKFSYLSPEAASGLEVDARADIFAVGIQIGRAHV